VSEREKEIVSDVLQGAKKEFTAAGSNEKPPKKRLRESAEENKVPVQENVSNRFTFKNCSVAFDLQN
jgi:hypothetical protein